jgi:hypothetical protein
MLPRKTIIALLFSSLLVFASIGFAGDHCRSYSLFDGQIYSFDEIIIDIDDGSVFITHEYEDDEIEITRKYELYVNGDLVETNQEQKDLLEEFHTAVMDLEDQAIEIGKEGAKIGIEGAKIGLHAARGVLKMLFTEYDEDDLDRDLEFETELLEKKAEKLEEKAEELEKIADDLDDMFYDMEEEIPEIASLDW